MFIFQIYKPFKNGKKENAGYVITQKQPQRDKYKTLNHHHLQNTQILQKNVEKEEERLGEYIQKELEGSHRL